MSHPQAPSDPTASQVVLPHGTASYVEEGAGPVVLAVHGLPGSLRDFRWLAPALSPHFRVIRVDLPGFGGTPWTSRPGYTPSDRAAFLLDFAEAMELPPAVLLGHSMGGVVSAAFAQLAPERVRALGFLSSPGLRLHRGLRRMPSRALSGFFAGKAKRPLSMAVLRRGFRLAGFRGAYPDEALLHTLHGVAALDIALHAQRIQTLTVPSLLAWCEDDPLIEPAIPIELADVLPQGPRLRFETGGHNPQKHHANEIAVALRTWAPALD